MTSAIGTSSYGTLDRMLASAGSLRDQYATLQQQTTSGLVSQSYSGLSSVSAQVLDLSAATSQNDAYTKAITQTQGKASVMQNALSQLSTLVSSMAASALSVTGSSPAAAVTGMAQQASQALSQLVSVLNTTYAGDYVFAGADTAKPAVANGASGPILSGSFAAPVTVQIGSGHSVVLGSSPSILGGAISNIMTQLAAMAISTSPANAVAMQTAATTLTAAGATLAQESGQIGLTQNAMTAATASYSSMQTLLTSQLSGLVNVDMATAISHMQTVNTQLQASYKVLGEVSSLNLASFL